MGTLLEMFSDIFSVRTNRADSPLICLCAHKSQLGHDLETLPNRGCLPSFCHVSRRLLLGEVVGSVGVSSDGKG